MLTVHHISKSFGIDPVLEDISFNINPGEKIGLVGPNGSGKTTLLRMITGLEKADQGTIQFKPSALRFGYLPQGFNDFGGDTISSFLNRMEGDLEVLAKRLADLAEAISQFPDRADLLQEYDSTLSELQYASERETGRGPTVLAALGLGGLALDQPVTQLSGGQKTRLGLAGVLLSNPQLLLLDEPTNHLDFVMLEWLENWLVNSTCAALFVSHDRAFLDKAATSILEIDSHTHQARLYPGNYSAYLEQKKIERARQMQEYLDQLDEISRLRASAAHLRGIATFRRGGKADSGDKFAKGFFANRALETVGRAKHIEARLEQLMTEDKVDKPRRTWHMKMEFNEPQSSGRDVLILEKLSVGYAAQTLIENLDQYVRFGERLVIIGPNGCGKTTLLKTIIGSIPAIRGHFRLGSNVRIGYMAQEQEELSLDLNAFRMVRDLAALSETDARAFLSKFLFKGDDVFTPIGRLSYGERARLSLACLVARGCNFLMLDEPINHLDIPSRASFEQALASFEGTILAVVHDRYFIERFATSVWEVMDKNLIVHRFDA